MSTSSINGKISFFSRYDFIKKYGYTGYITIQEILKKISITTKPYSNSTIQRVYTDYQQESDIVYTVTFTNMVFDTVSPTRELDCNTVLANIKNHFKGCKVKIPIDRDIPSFYVCDNVNVFLGYRDTVQEIPLDLINENLPLPNTNMGYYYIEAKDISKPMNVYITSKRYPEDYIMISNDEYILMVKDGTVYFKRHVSK